MLYCCLLLLKILSLVLTVLFLTLTTGLCVAIRRRAQVTEKNATKPRSHLSVGAPNDLKQATLVTTLPSKVGEHPRHVVHSSSFAPDRVFSPFAVEPLRQPAQRALGVAPASQSCSGTMFGFYAAQSNPPSLLDILRDVKAPSQSPPLAASSTASTARVDQSSNSSEGIYAEPCSTAPLLPPMRSPHAWATHSAHSHNSPSRRNRTLPAP